MTSASVSEVNTRPVGVQLLLERHVVLDDAVDHDVDAIAAVVVGVRVLLADAPVGRPARVADARARRPLGHGHAPGGRRARLQRELRAQDIEVAHGAHGLDAVAVDNRDAGRVIAAVLELAEAGEQQLPRGPPAYVANDSAHRFDDTSARGRASRARAAMRARARRAARRAQTSSASRSVGASTITRTSGSVPLGRTSTRPRPASSLLGCANGLADAPARAASASRSRTRTLTRRWGSLRHRVALAEVAAAERLEREQRARRCRRRCG